MSDLKELSEGISTQIKVLLEAKKVLTGFVDEEKLNTYIAGMQYLQNMVLDYRSEKQEEL